MVAEAVCSGRHELHIFHSRCLVRACKSCTRVLGSILPFTTMPVCVTALSSMRCSRPLTFTARMTASPLIKFASSHVIILLQWYLLFDKTSWRDSSSSNAVAGVLAAQL